MTTTIKTSPVVQQLQAAKRLIESGWTKGQWCRSFLGWRAYCVVGAMVTAAKPNEKLNFLGTSNEALDEAYRLFEEVIDNPAITAWNDAKNRNKEEVIAAFDKAIALALETSVV